MVACLLGWMNIRARMNEYPCQDEWISMPGWMNIHAWMNEYPCQNEWITMPGWMNIHARMNGPASAGYHRCKSPLQISIKTLQPVLSDESRSFTKNSLSSVFPIYAGCNFFTWNFYLFFSFSTCYCLKTFYITISETNECFAQVRSFPIVSLLLFKSLRKEKSLLFDLFKAFD